MTTPAQWRKSSFSGGGEGNDCVEISNLHTRVAIRDSKDRTRTSLSFPTEAFSTFITSLKARTR
ncbi:DUF397 domain-containing protein [Streptomyces cupreus]|uniref:DUF397 domain-containing protein n=1 Tax=Streptomyces cupreus TaxID=2759956 RepID=A0A7X1JCK8_9ACTN|nr:DUF397 domain-containing protein [Streptomyces cupreus]MBC2908235.1 DUF397 domain-containing protein [Streptomyces cupreus]